ncbi:MAG: chromosome segregation protein, partial [Micromonosporaceae bacterium]|nr:chromosome segregation protein [Micromonosporaceae bacterium]
TLTVDNSDGALPIDFTEVSITRRMFRDGAGEYEINGSHCRLLDIQELLSDSGIGREMHVIVGQGQLDSVLHADPMGRRAFIEEAAGVLKHRKRKEKALRKLESMGANLNRLNDLTAELRRQLKPLGRQAEVARRAAGIQADLRDARIRLLADDLATLRETVNREVADETALRERREEVEASYEQVQERLAELESALAEDAPVLAQAQETFLQLSTLQERLRATYQLATERHRNLSTDLEDERPGRDPDELAAQAEEMREQERVMRESLADDQARLNAAVEGRQQMERRLVAAEQALVAAVKAIADRREGLAKLVGQVNAVRSRATAAADEIARLEASFEEAQDRAIEASEQYEMASDGATEADRGTAELDERHAEAVSVAEAVAAMLKELSDTDRTAEREAAQWKAREDALAIGLRRKDGAGALLASSGRIPGLLGSVAALLTVQPGYEAALAAALGTLADAVAVSDVDGAQAAIELLKADDLGRAAVVIGGSDMPPKGDRPALPEGARWALDVVEAPDNMRASVTRLLQDVVFAPDFATARTIVSYAPELRTVTPEGDLLGAFAAVGGSSKQPSFIEVQAAVEEARQRKAEAEGKMVDLRAKIESVKEQQAAAREAVAKAVAARKEAEGQRNAAGRRLAELGAAARSARAEADRIAQNKIQAEQARDRDVAGLVDLEERLRNAEATPIDTDPSTVERDELAAAVPAARQHEIDVRLAVRTAEERVGALSGRADALARQATAERQARERAAARRAARARGAAVAREVVAGAEIAVAQAAKALIEAGENRDAVARARVGRENELAGVRTSAKQLGGELERLTSKVHRDEVARAEQRMRIEQLQARTAEEFGIDPESLTAEYGPHLEVPPTAPDMAAAEAEGRPVPQPVPYDRATQEKRAAKAERELTLLGKVNPLALEEFAAMEERFKFLSDQLEDVKATRRDLMTVVKDVDERILEVFASAYEDTAREFEQVFTVLFPGGEGRLVLTDPDDMLTTGI